MKICYYDNMTCENNPPEIIYGFVRELLDWVDKHDAFLTIKTKSRPAMRKLKHFHLWMFWRLIPAKEVYKDYPQDIIHKIVDLKIKRKLEMAYGLDNIEPAIDADVVVVVPTGEIIFKLPHYKHILLFNHDKSDMKNLTLFKKAEELNILLKRRNYEITRLDFDDSN